MKKRSFRSTFVSVILVITVAISIVNLVRYILVLVCMKNIKQKDKVY